MAGESARSDLLNPLKTLAHLGAAGDLSDSQLLQRFLSGSDDASRAAFSILLDRHGPMVLRACRHILGDSHDAQDAFQATFFVLARKAGSVREIESVAGWLLGVSLRVARRARSDEARRRSHERRCAAMKATESGEPEAGDESWPELHEEVARLPDRYREPVVLCYLEGLSTEAAASRIGCPRGTVLSRLSRARERLRRRLARRGVVPSAIPLALGQASAVSPSLLQMTARAAIEFASTRTFVNSLATASAAELTRGILFAMTISKLRVIASAALACLLTVGGVYAVARNVGREAIEGPGRRAQLVAREPARGQDGPDEAVLKRRADALKQLKIEVEQLGGFVDDNGSRVVLERTNAADADLERIAPLLRELPQLRRLVLGHSLITDAGLVHVRDLTQLTWLYLENTAVSDAGLAHLKGLTNLVGLPLQDTDVGDEGMKVVSGMPRMEWLSLGNTRVGDEGLRHLSGLDRLEVLTLEETPITDAGLAHLKGLHRLRYLHLDNTRITDKGLESLKGLVKLQRLHLCDTDITDAGLVNLESMKDLYYLMLHNTIDTKSGVIRSTVKISDAGLDHLRGLTSLQTGSLFLWNTSVTEAGAARLQRALPHPNVVAIGEMRIVGFTKGHHPRGKPKGGRRDFIDDSPVKPVSVER
jgi:RNA polymerase sigma factor (sigma-70 family)